MSNQTNQVKTNYIYIWAEGDVENLIEVKETENPNLDVRTPVKLLDALQGCLKHSTYFREARDEFYNLKQHVDENTTSYYSRIMQLYKSAVFPQDTNFLIVDRLIHGCTNKKCNEKLMTERKVVPVNKCLDVLRQYDAGRTTMQRIDGEESKINAVYSRSRDPTRYSQRNGGKQRKQRSHHVASGETSEKKKKCFLVWRRNTSQERKLRSKVCLM